MKKKLLTFLSLILSTLSVMGQVEKPLPTLHVEGKWLVDTHGNHVVLHGVMDTPSAYFNGGRWSGGYTETGATNCKNYFEKIYTGLEKANCNVFRLHLDPAWTNNSNKRRIPIGTKDGKLEDGGEANISQFDSTYLKKWLTSLYVPLMTKAINHRMYVVVRPPGVCPPGLKVGDFYQDYLKTVWNIVSKNAIIKKYAGQISLELANEPIDVKNADGTDNARALHDYFQPIVDIIRANGFTGVIWIPGTGWQANYTSYKTYPIEGYNIGYAVHDYTGWFGASDDHCDPASYIKQFRAQVPVVETHPIIITEVDWSPNKPGQGHYNEHGDWVASNYGTWSTGSTSKWGKAYKALLDHYGNISMTLSGTACLIDIDELPTVVPAFGGLEEACGKACMDWYADYAKVDYPKRDFTSVPVSDQKNGKFKNPVVRADFPDPDVIRVGDTYYMVSTTMHHFPGATILKSKDMVNWEYCAHPLTQLATTANYNLLNGNNAYAGGMWACSMKYHNGKFYILINGNDAGGWILTATDPEGKWTKKKLDRIYYDPGMLFDNGKVYIACGNGNIQVCELDEDFNFKQKKDVVSKPGSGLEGCHLYKRGDYYYIYATYGGWPSGQVAFRSKSIFGPYEEKMIVEKTIDGKVNTIHQGSLIEDVAGDWWTIMQEDLGALGRMPNLQPVKWVDDWPVVGNNGKPYPHIYSITKPVGIPDGQIEPLPTTDNFRQHTIGIQWEWNHNPNNSAWSLFERPGWLRLKTASVTNKLSQSRNMLTQRIFMDENNPSRGTIRLDVRRMQEGDRAGICILQDPYAAIGVKVKDGKYQVVWQEDGVREDKLKEKAIDLAIDSTIYLRASINYKTSNTAFYYSLDNKTWTVLGDPTTMSFNLSVFVGARFGLYSYATKNTGGAADFDWFTTETSFDEESLYPSFDANVKPEMFTVTQLTASDVSGMVGAWEDLTVTATFQDGHQENVASQAKFTVATPDIVTIRNGAISGNQQGSTTVTATYTDLFSNEHSATFAVSTSYFPFAKKFIKTDLFGNGTYMESTHGFKPAQWGQMGWEYSDRLDLSDYHYLVIELTRKQACDAHLNIFTAASIWSDCFASDPFGSKTRIVIDLQEAKYTSGNKKGQALDLKNIRIVDFWTNGSGTIYVKNIYVTNDPNSDPTVIAESTLSTEGYVDVHALNGQLLRRHISRTRALDGLPKGIYIVGGQKVVKD